MNSVSIVICTSNRADHLHHTLMSISATCVPGEIDAELIVVDNASTDNTAQVVQACRLPNVPVRWVHEPRCGKGYAYNTGMAEAAGQVLLFTDDDVRVPQNWIAGMCEPILQGQADAVAGGIRNAPHLKRSWMTDAHQSWFAAGTTSSGEADCLIGANMAYSKAVLAKVPAYDVELGPGALGLNDDILYSRQLKQAGYKMIATNTAVVEHHFGENRLTRQSLLGATEKYAASCAYMNYHWDHLDITHLRLRLLKAAASLSLWRSQNRDLTNHAEGLSLEEHHHVRRLHYLKHYRIERQRPRNYEKHGLIKLNGKQ